MTIDKPMAPMSPAVARVLVEVRSRYGDPIADTLQEYVDIERRLDWLAEHEPLQVVPSMTDEEIEDVINRDPNVVERQALVSRKKALFDRLPVGALAMYRFPGTPTVVLR